MYYYLLLNTDLRCKSKPMKKHLIKQQDHFSKIDKNDQQSYSYLVMFKLEIS